MMIDALSNALEKIAGQPQKNPDDYEKDGILYCGNCHEPKQAWIDWLPDSEGNAQKKLVSVLCKCEQERDTREDEIRKSKQFNISLNQMREDCGIYQPQSIKTLSLDNDDAPDSMISKTCRKYVAEWQKMKEKNIGILFYGSKGTGKSFYASCIVNALEKIQVPTAIVSTPSLMATLSGTWDKAEIIRDLNFFHLLAIDDLGAERSTEYASEIMYNVIDSRYRAKLPTIITTNLDLADMQAETDIWRSRIYDRVIEMCPIAIRMDGESRRSSISDEHRKMARDIMRNAREVASNGN